MQELQPAIVQSEFAELIRALKALSDQHDKTFRLEVGQLILQRLYSGDVVLAQSRDRTKPAKFVDFVAMHAEDIAQLNLSEPLLRRCMQVRICYDQLPLGVRDTLGYSALLAISRVAEPHDRARLAMAAVQQGWTVQRTKEAVALADQHRVWDADSEEEGLQLPEPGPAPRLQPGRLVARTEKWSEAIELWQAEFAQVDVAKLSKAQVERLKAALAAAKARLETVEAGLG